MAVGIAEIVILSLVAAWLLKRVHMPGLLGMLVVGVVLGPCVLDCLAPELLAIGSDLRLIALIAILLRVGLELNRRTLARVGYRVLLLSFLPATCEGLMITLAGPPLLGLTLFESAILGSVLAAVSPAVVVPLMIRFIKERKGAVKAIPSMVMAAASVDDIYVVVAHGVILGAYVGQRVNTAWQVAGVPISLLLGSIVGVIIGFSLCRLFDRFKPRVTKQVLVILAIAIMLVKLQHIAAGRIPFASLVATMMIGFVILEKREHMAHKISAKLASFWIFAEIILFSMVGAQVDVSVAWGAGAAAVAVIALGLAARSCMVFICLINSPLSVRERLFVAASFLPKATVQAAIGASPLLAMKMAGMDTGPGETILAVAVVSIILTAPVGACLISFLGDRLLEVAPETEHAAYDAALESSPNANL